MRGKGEGEGEAFWVSPTPPVNVFVMKWSRTISPLIARSTYVSKRRSSSK